MRKITLSTIWAVTPTKKTKHGEIISVYQNPREIKNVNLQTDYSELDVAAYGERINEMCRIRTLNVPDLHKGDHVYLAKPAKEDEPGDYEVVSVKAGYSNNKLRRNPTVIDLKKVTK